MYRVTPCDVDAIQTVADNDNLKVIDDAAHAFGVRDQGGSILRHCDLSVLSFQATKVFNTCEGGAIICPDDKTKQHIDPLKNVGFESVTTVVASSINGKDERDAVRPRTVATQAYRPGPRASTGH